MKKRVCEETMIENFLEPCLLYLLLEKPNYGYEIQKELERRCLCHVNTGNLYRSLNYLLKQKHLAREKVKSEAGPEKIFYSITATGKKYLSRWIDALVLQQKTIKKLVTSYHRIV